MKSDVKDPTQKDVKNLSAYLDGKLSGSAKKHLEHRLTIEPSLASVLEELRQTRALLRRTPHRRAPRNFTLTAAMTGVRPPVPRLVPALSWASAIAALLFFFTLGTGLLNNLAMQSQAPLRAAAPEAYGGGGLPPAATMAPALAAPALTGPATEAPVLEAPATRAPAADNAIAATATPEISIMSVPEAATPDITSTLPSTKASRHPPRSPWLFIWPGLAVLLAAIALLIRWLNRRSFKRKNRAD
jgi:anti-sigma factor RsiW